MKNTSLIIFIVMALALAFLAAPAVATEEAGVSAPQKDESLRKGETRDTLNPAQFSHPTIKKAYEVAKEIPWVLDSIYCYCRCKENPYFRHKSLLSCYVDDHAAQ